MEIFGWMPLIALHNQAPPADTGNFGAFGCVLHPPSVGSQLCPRGNTWPASFTWNDKHFWNKLDTTEEKEEEGGGRMRKEEEEGETVFQLKYDWTERYFVFCQWGTSPWSYLKVLCKRAEATQRYESVKYHFLSPKHQFSKGNSLLALQHLLLAGHSVYFSGCFINFKQRKY